MCLGTLSAKQNASCVNWLYRGTFGKMIQERNGPVNSPRPPHPSCFLSMLFGDRILHSLGSHGASAVPTSTSQCWGCSPVPPFLLYTRLGMDPRASLASTLPSKPHPRHSTVKHNHKGTNRDPKCQDLKDFVMELFYIRVRAAMKAQPNHEHQIRDAHVTPSEEISR